MEVFETSLLEPNFERIKVRVVNMMESFHDEFTTIYLANHFEMPYHAMKLLLEEAQKANLVVRNPENHTWRYNH